MIAERAEPPMQEELIKPKIVPRFSSGSASIMAELNMVFPAVFTNAPIKENMQVRIKLFDIYAATINTDCRVKLIAIIQNRVLELNFTIPSMITEIREAAVHTDIR